MFVAVFSRNSTWRYDACLGIFHLSGNRGGGRTVASFVAAINKTSSTLSKPSSSPEPGRCFVSLTSRSKGIHTPYTLSVYNASYI